MSAPVADPEFSPWLSVARTVSRSGRHPVTVRKALETGELHGHQRCRRGRWHIHIASADAWIRGERDTTTPCGCERLPGRRRR